MLRDRLAKLLLILAGRLPLAANHALGALLGWFAWHFAGEMRRITLINLARCFPERDARWRRAVARQSLMETAKAITEAPYLWRLPAAGIQGLVREIHGEEALREGLKSPQGVIFASPHLGCWEFMGLYLPEHTALTSLYRPPRIQLFNRMMREGREHTGATLVPTDASGIKALRKALSQGQATGILPDQTPRGAKGVFAPFFGIPAYTMVLLNRLAQASQAPVLLCFAERLPRGRGYRLHFHTAPGRIADADPVVAATTLNAGVEALIRLAPSQYAWSYKRFKKRPPGDTGGNVYPKPR